MKDRFENSDYRSLPGAKFVMETEIDYANLQSDWRVDLDSVIAQNKPFEKLVFGCVADNMKLPFADNCFEAYVSNLSLMIVQHRERMIQEAFRVLKPGARACISTWGHEENMSVFRIFRQAHTNIGRQPPANDFDRYWALTSDLNEFRKMFVDAGFVASDIRIWH